MIPNRLVACLLIVALLVWPGAAALPVENAASAPREHPLVPAIELARQSLERLRDVHDYECHFTKRERIDGQLKTQVMKMRIREQPFSLYCLFGEPHAGREILYVAGRNNGEMLAHEGSGLKSLIGTISVPVDGPRAMAENRHPVSQAGLRNLLQLLIRQWELETRYGEITVTYYPHARIGNTACRVIQTVHPQPRKQFLYHITRLYLDESTGLPLRLENYGWPPNERAIPPLMEEYTYLNVRTNIGFTDRHFDRNCEEYNF